MKHKRFRYQHPGSTLTLREGLREYREGHPHLVKEAGASREAAELFHSHDICHVVFGLDTTLDDETLADTWTILGTTVPFRTYLGYMKQEEAKNILKEAGVKSLVVGFLRALPKMVLVWYYARQMTHKWPWKDHEKYLDMPLHQIRTQFNIRILE